MPVKNESSDGWSLLGLYNSLKAQHKTAAAAKYRMRYQQAFAAGDVRPVASLF
ncbi:hypothetical protein [Mucilaginibacter sp.]|uniref:hypothetical protein n=1 Tax=Mucilaginibacter sp. TaxID=1882438 RepID=UPI00261D8668|nr:hypothetical protein [Mucilaginibacter sp.]